MSPPSLNTLPREIRDRIYDFVWDLGRDVSLSAPLRIPRKRKFLPFDRFFAKTMLALLHVNHQISAEAAFTFYGKRVFCSRSKQLLPFLGSIGLRRYLIRDIEVLEAPDGSLRLPPQTFDILQTLSSLRSFTIKIRKTSFKTVQNHLVRIGVYKLTGRMDVNVHSERARDISYYELSGSKSIGLLERVIFTNTSTCAKGETEWRSEGFRCRVSGRVNKELIWVDQKNLSSQPCDHKNHSSGRV